jgi:hypothetical protein
MHICFSSFHLNKPGLRANHLSPPHRIGALMFQNEQSSHEMNATFRERHKSTATSRVSRFR